MTNPLKNGATRYWVMTKTTSELEIGNVIELYKGAFGYGTVFEKAKDYVKVVRPYIHMLTSIVCDENEKFIRTEILKYSDPPVGITTIGSETIKLHFDSSAQWNVVT
jgi:hypothetical protein